MRVLFTIVLGLLASDYALTAMDTEHAKNAPATLMMNKIKFTKPDWATNERRQSDGSTVFSRELAHGVESNGTASDAERSAQHEIEKTFPVLAGRLEVKGTSPRTQETMNSAGKLEIRNDGYLVQFDITVDGIRVWDDYVTVSVRGNDMEAVSLRGHAVEAATAKKPVLAVNEAVEKSRSAVSLATFEADDFELNSAYLCYLSSTPIKSGSENEPATFILAWHVPVNERATSRRGSKAHVWVDAFSGKLLAQKPF